MPEDDAKTERERHRERTLLPGLWQLESSVNDPDDAAPESEDIAKSQKPN